MTDKDHKYSVNVKITFKKIPNGTVVSLDTLNVSDDKIIIDSAHSSNIRGKEL